jgi:hypothetical protein
MACHFCYNAHVWAKESHTEEGSFDVGLHDGNDFSSSSIGCSGEKYQMRFNSGNGQACNIELCTWREGYGWLSVAKYFPKFCPECGRKLDEYDIFDRGAYFKRRPAKE